MKYFFLVLVLFVLPLKVLAGNPEPDYSDQILISEFLPNPAGADPGQEWVELFNDSDEDVYLAGWQMDDESATGPAEAGAYAFPDDAVILARDYLTVDLGEKNFALNNTGHDSVRLISPDGEVKQEVAYIGPVEIDESYARQDNGSYAWTTATTKNEPNAIAKPETDAGEEETEPAETEKYSDQIKIQSLLPNPAGSDPGHEWVSLNNGSDEDVSLKDWILDDGAKDSAIGASALKLGDILIEAGDEVEIDIPSGNFAMNNTGEESVRLFSPDRKLMDIVTYTGTEEDEVITFGKGADHGLPVTGMNPGLVLMLVGTACLALWGMFQIVCWYKSKNVTNNTFFA
jgi:hypothetical protein